MNTSAIPGSLHLTGAHALKNRCITGFGIGVPTAAAIVAVVLLSLGIIHFTLIDLALFAFMHTITGLGVTVGLHRLFTHKSFEAGQWTQAMLAILGIMALQGSVTGWVACHRRHHRYSDDHGDPHSPAALHQGRFGAFRALFFVHISRLFLAEDTDAKVYASDLCRNPMIQRVDRLALVWIFLTFALPALGGWWLEGGLYGAFSGLLWGGLVRIFIGQHIGSCVNSICHMFGRAIFKTNDKSKNNFWIGLAAFGEGWHNNHHAFPSSARQGLLWWQLDLSYVLIASLKKVGLAWNVNVPTAEKISKKRSECSVSS